MRTAVPRTEAPVLSWTVADDPLDFRYEFLEGLRTVELYRGSPATGAWNHHTMIAHIDGVVYASWDQHVRDENAAGQHGLLRRSHDKGRTRTAVEELFPPLADKVPADDPYPHVRFQSNNGFVVVDGIIYAVTDVAEWQRPGAQKARPRTNLGRMARAVHPEGGLGDIFWLLEEAPRPVPGYPKIPVGDPRLVKQINDIFADPGNAPQLQFGRGFPPADDNHAVGEPVAWQLDDGTWVRIFRDNGLRGLSRLRDREASKSRRNYVSFSFDDGKTWTAPTRTSFPDACGRSSAGRLPDGQYYVINAAWPMPNKAGQGRSLQAISLSRDGLIFDRMAVIQFPPPARRYEGRSKAPGFQAHSVVVGDHLLVLTSVNKEDIQLKRIPLSVLP